jgi:uncharacterized ion transporter superfamily protein YfcC
MAGAFLLLGIICILISGMKISEATQVFIRGMEEMVVGFARGVQVVLKT